MDEQRISHYLDLIWQRFLDEDFTQALLMLELSDRVAGREPVTALFP